MKLEVCTRILVIVGGLLKQIDVSLACDVLCHLNLNLNPQVTACSLAPSKMGCSVPTCSFTFSLVTCAKHIKIAKRT